MRPLPEMVGSVFLIVGLSFGIVLFIFAVASAGSRCALNAGEAPALAVSIFCEFLGKHVRRTYYGGRKERGLEWARS